MSRKHGFMLLPMLLFVLASPFTANAFPIASVGTEGLKVIVASVGDVIATYQGNSASFSNDLYLMLNGSGIPADDGILGNDLFIFNNHTSAVGSTLDLGSFAVGTELIFRLFVNNTGYNYYTGPASRNPDGMAHARVQGNWLPNESLVSFEDLFGTPEGVNGYNDLSFSFTNTAPPPPVPEPTTLALLGLGVAGLIARKRPSKSRIDTRL